MYHSFSFYNAKINNLKDIINLKEDGIIKKIGVSAYLKKKYKLLLMMIELI